jgi:hypothetical protein
MAFVVAMCVIETEYAAVVSFEQMRQEEGKIVSNYFSLFIDPNLITKNADPTGTPTTSFVIGVLAKTPPSTHKQMLAQVMFIMHHLDALFTS